MTSGGSPRRQPGPTTESAKRRTNHLGRSGSGISEKTSHGDEPEESVYGDPMPICPVCLAEYREGFSRCEACNADLVEHVPETGDRFQRLERAAASGQAVLSDPRTLEDAQRDAELLRDAQIPCLLQANPSVLGPSGAPLYYHLVLLAEDVVLARETIQSRRDQMLAAEGLAHSDVVVDLSASRITCPACGFTFPRAEECPDCGLFVGHLPPDEAAAVAEAAAEESHGEKKG